MDVAVTLDVLRERIAGVQSRIAAACGRAGRSPDEVTLVAVTKTVPASVIALLPQLNIFDCGENRPQVLWEKAAGLSHLPIRWHLVGHLQRNKLDRTWPLLRAFHAADSLRVLRAIPAGSTEVFLQVNASREDQKHGFEFDDLLRDAASIAELPVQVVGLMTMAAIGEDPEAARPTFAALRTFRDRLRAAEPRLSLNALSMGMSGDFEVAVEEGATHVRVGTTLFDGLGEDTRPRA